MANDPSSPLTSSPSATAPGSPNATATSTPPFDAAAAIAQLHQLISLIPGFEPPDKKVWQKIGRKGAFPNEYVESAANIVDASPQVSSAVSVDATTLRNGVALSNGIQALINEALNFADGLRFTDAKLRATLVDACDQVYALSPGVARTNRSLTPHIEAMRHASRRKGGRKKAVTPPATTSPTTAPTATTPSATSAAASQPVASPTPASLTSGKVA
jgi:hypothetical protein